MPQTFSSLVEITGAGNQTLELKSEDALASDTKLMAVTSNNITESQLQFKSKFSLVAPLTGRAVLVALEDGSIGIGAPLPGANLAVTGENNRGIDLLCTNGKPSHIRLLAVNSNNILEGQLQFLGQFSLTGIPSSASNPTGNGNALTYRDSGVLVLSRPQGQQGIVLDPSQGGGISLFDTTNKRTIYLQQDGNIQVGGNIQVDGDLILSAADCAEEFDISEGGHVEPGTVMVLDKHGNLRESLKAYDKKVAGVISGAGKWRPGIVLDKKQARHSRQPLALVGKVYCKADADPSCIEIGDLLTTSDNPGHAMKARDRKRVFGSVLGKALCALQTGQGLIPILIALQ